MRKKICKKCGKEFHTETGKHWSYMCPECRLESKRESVYRERICTICGEHFLDIPLLGSVQFARKKGQKNKSDDTIPPILPGTLGASIYAKNAERNTLCFPGCKNIALSAPEK